MPLLQWLLNLSGSIAPSAGQCSHGTLAASLVAAGELAAANIRGVLATSDMRGLIAASSVVSATIEEECP
jgi:hypothetical protein